MKSRNIHPSDPSDFMIRPARENIQALVEATLLITKASIWKGSDFSTGQLSTIQHQLTNHLLNAASPYDAYRQLVQEILTLHNLVLNNKVCQSIFLSKLSEVISPNVNFPRTYTNVYHVFAESVLSMVEDPSAANKNYWVELFKERNADFSLQLFYTIIHELSISAL